MYITQVYRIFSRQKWRCGFRNTDSNWVSYARIRRHKSDLGKCTSHVKGCSDGRREDLVVFRLRKRFFCFYSLVNTIMRFKFEVFPQIDDQLNCFNHTIRRWYPVANLTLCRHALLYEITARGKIIQFFKNQVNCRSKSEKPHKFKSKIFQEK